MKVVTADNQFECARVYVDKRNRSIFTVKCYYCCREFKHWTRFVAHIEARHSDLKRAYLRAKNEWTEYKQTRHLDVVEDEDDDAAESWTESEVQHTSQPTEAEPMLQETELVLIAVEPDSGVEEKSESVCQVVEYENEEDEEPEFSSGLKDQQQVVDLQFERMPIEFVNAESESEADAVTKLEQCSRKRRRSTDNMQSESDDNETTTTQHVTSQWVNHKSPESEEIAAEYSKTENYHMNESCEELDEMQPLPVGARYLQLRTTEPSIMSTFIKIMSRHPCQWNPQHPDFEIKDRRDESSEEICKELKERVRIDITPQMARASVCYLRRWFEREYLRAQSTKRTEKHQEATKGGAAKVRGVYTCSHPEYYKQLVDFLPQKHLALRTCDKCPRKFKTDQQLQSHQYHKHGGEMPHRCEYCGRCFLYQSTLRHHENRHTRERIWQCKQCDYSCTSKTDYGMHMVTHTDIRAYVCELCGAAYKSSASLSVHRRSHGEPSLECNLCGKKFFENYQFKKHMWKHEADSAANAAVAEHEAELLAESSMETERLNSTTVRKASTVASTNSLSEEYNFESNSSCSGSEDNVTEVEATAYGCTLCERDFDNLKALRAHGLRIHKVYIA